jgi:hypothetical protein
LVSQIEGNDGDTTIMTSKGEKTLKELCCEIIKRKPNGYADIYCKLAEILPHRQSVIINGQVFIKKTLYIKAIEIDPKLNEGEAYWKLADILSRCTYVTINGQNLRKKELYVKALNVNSSKNGFLYLELGNLLSTNECLLIDGKEVGRQLLYLRALEYDAGYAIAYYHLANTLRLKDCLIQLLDGRVMTKEELYLEAIQCNPSHALTYYHLANILPENRSIQLLDGRVMTKEELYLEAIDHDSKLVTAYFSLFWNLSPVKTIMLGGKHVFRYEIAHTITELDPTCLTLHPGFKKCYLEECIAMYAFILEIEKKEIITDQEKEIIKKKPEIEAKMKMLKLGTIYESKKLY